MLCSYAKNLTLTVSLSTGEGGEGGGGENPWLFSEA